jgi:hypothetical protein
MNRRLSVVLAALIAVVVSGVATGIFGGLIIVSSTFVILPSTQATPYLLGGVLLVLFGFFFWVVFREMIGKFTR